MGGAREWYTHALQVSLLALFKFVIRGPWIKLAVDFKRGEEGEGPRLGPGGTSFGGFCEWLWRPGKPNNFIAFRATSVTWWDPRATLF